MFISLWICLGGAGVTALTASRRRLTGWLALGFTAASSALALLAAGHSLLAGDIEPETFLRVPALGFALTLHVDGLSALFIGLIASIAIPAALFSIEYLELYPEYSVRRYHPYLLIFIAALYGLVSTTDMMWFFLLFWQMMTLPGYALIRFEHRNAANRRAATKFLILMQIACALTMIGAALLAFSAPAPAPGGESRFDFATISAAMPGLLADHPVLTATAFALFLAGFGIKLGMWPFGRIWLPDAHPAAPSPMSALLSGVMLKTGVYGVMRYFFWLVPATALDRYPAAAWGGWIAAFGTVTLATGTLQALRQEQTKRLLAFHSIGQLGYILLGLGTALMLLGSGQPALQSVAAVAFVGALLHTLFHGTFKSLLFLNAGSMLRAAGTQNLNQLGGLMKWMPLTGVTALIASFAISGVPGCNGFLSKWTIYTGAIQGAPGGRLLPVAAVIGMLISVVTLASFMKFFGAAFLGRASRRVIEQAEKQSGRLEVPWSMQLPQLFLAAACLLFGLWPLLAYGLAARTLLASADGLGAPLAQAVAAAETLPGVRVVLTGGAVAAPLLILLLVGLLAALTAWVSRLGGAQRRVVPPWLTGQMMADETNRFTAHGYYADLKRALRRPRGAAAPPPPRPPASSS